MYENHKFITHNKIPISSATGMPLVRYHPRIVDRGKVGYGIILHLDSNPLSSGFLAEYPLCFWRITHDYSSRIPGDEITFIENDVFSDELLIIQRHYDGPFTTCILQSIKTQYLYLMGIDDLLSCMLFGMVSNLVVKGDFYFVSYQQVYYLRRA